MFKFPKPLLYRLVRSERRGQKVRAVTLLNLGRHGALPRAPWPALCARREEVLSGQQAVLPLASRPVVETAAQRYAALRLARHGERQAAAGGAGAVVATAADLQPGDMDSLACVRPRTIGVEAVALWALPAVGVIELFIRLGVAGPLRALIVGRLSAAWPTPPRSARRAAPRAGAALRSRRMTGGCFRRRGREGVVSGRRCLDAAPYRHRGRGL